MLSIMKRHAMTPGMIGSVLFLSLMGAIRGNAQTQPPSLATYKTTPDRELKMRLTYPADWKQEDRRAALVFFYNGGWNASGASRQFDEQAAYFAQRGMVVAQADYREKDKSGPTPAKCIEDVFTAVRWVRSHAAEQGVDPARVAAGGGSGSGHLAASAFYTGEIHAPGEDLSLSPIPGALMLYNPDLDVIPPDMMQRMCGGEKDGARRMPPTVVFYGSIDPSRKPIEDYVARARKNGMPVEAFAGEGAPHGFFKFSPWLEKTTLRADQLLQSAGYLKAEPKADPPSKAKPAGYDEMIAETMSRWEAKHEAMAAGKGAIKAADAGATAGANAATSVAAKTGAKKKKVRAAPAQPEEKPSSGTKAAIRGAPTSATLIYKTLGERKLQLAAHYPPGWSKEDKRPAVLLFSGGHKVKEDANGNLPPLAAERAKRGLPVVNAGPKGPGAIHTPLAEHFAQKGLVCFRVEYRTRNKDGVLPGADLEDAVDAMRWVRRNAAALGIDPVRVVAAGCSSGGYLASGIFALEDLAPKDEGAPPVSARPDALLLFSPLLDWLEAGPMTDEFLVVLGGDKELGAKLSPIRHWRADMPPTLILEGTEEPPFATVKAFADKWMAQGAPLEIFIAEGGPHGFFGKPEWVEKANARADEFLQKLGYLYDAPRVEPPALPKKSEKSEKSEKGARGEKGATDTAARLASMLKRTPEADANKDGILTMEEAQAYKGKTKKPKGAAPAAGAPSTTDSASLPKPSRDWDKDRDGKISKAEFKAPGALFDNLDFDHDGFLSGDELAKLDSKLNLGKTDDAVWIVPPDKDYHGVQYKSYHSVAMNTEIGYNIYLPDEYQASGKRYPVIYHLHGSGGNESSQVNLSAVYHKAITEKKMCPVIIVFANGGKHSYYCDGANGKVMAETTIIKELIPHIDGAYRTIPERACRVIHGFSMGGFGAMKLGFKYPDLFCAVLSFGGGMASPDSVHLDFLKHIVGDDDRIIAENNPADLALKNKDALGDMSIWLFTGTRDVAREDSTWAHEWLRSHGIAHHFEVSEDVGHAVNRHYDFFGDDIYKMLMKHFEESKTLAPQTVGELAAQLRAEGLAARAKAALGLIEQGAGAKEAYPALIEALTQDEALDHAVAVHALYREPRPAGDTPALAAALGLSTKARVAAAWELSRIGPTAAPAVPALIAALGDKDKHARNFAAVALAAIGPEAREAIPALEAVLKDEGDPRSPQMNYKYSHTGADFALSCIKPAAVKTGATSDVAFLVWRLKSEAAPDHPAFDSGLRALGGYAGTAKPVGKGKNRALPPVHESVTLALAYLASLDKPPSPEEIARQENAGELADSARTYLMALGGLQQGLVPVLAESVQRSQSDARAQAIRDLGALGPAAREAAPLLQTALRDHDWIVRYEAYYALRRIDPAFVAPSEETGKRSNL